MKILKSTLAKRILKMMIALKIIVTLGVLSAGAIKTSGLLVTNLTTNEIHNLETNNKTMEE